MMDPVGRVKVRLQFRHAVVKHGVLARRKGKEPKASQESEDPLKRQNSIIQGFLDVPERCSYCRSLFPSLSNAATGGNCTRYYHLLREEFAICLKCFHDKLKLHMDKGDLSAERGQLYYFLLRVDNKEQMRVIQTENNFPGRESWRKHALPIHKIWNYSAEPLYCLECGVEEKEHICILCHSHNERHSVCSACLKLDSSRFSNAHIYVYNNYRYFYAANFVLDRFNDE